LACWMRAASRARPQRRGLQLLRLRTAGSRASSWAGLSPAGRTAPPHVALTQMGAILLRAINAGARATPRPCGLESITEAPFNLDPQPGLVAINGPDEPTHRYRTWRRPWASGAPCRSCRCLDPEPSAFPRGLVGVLSSPLEMVNTEIGWSLRASVHGSPSCPGSSCQQLVDLAAQHYCALS